MPASLAEAYGGLLLVALACIPTGLTVLRGFEALVRHHFSLTLAERAILAIYATGALLFFLASIPLPLYGSPLIVVILLLGWVVYAYRLLREHLKDFWRLMDNARAPALWGVFAGFLGLLLFELAPLWNHPFSNAWDGSVTALWTNLILRHGTIPTNLQPYANAPVLYPLAGSVWMTVPVLLLGWPVVQSPILVPALFLSLTVPAAYAWGARWTRGMPSAQTPVALTFAAFFGLVASVPRLYTGGWYDFALALPLLIVVIGFLPEWAGERRPDWKRLVGMGLLVGTVTSLSLAAGEAAIVLALAFVIVRHGRALRELATRFGQILVLVLFELAFTLRSVLAWFQFQGSAYVPKGYYGKLDPRLILGELDPFVPWKEKLSPFPVVALELQILLATGLVVAVILVLRPTSGTGARVGRTFGVHLLTGSVASFLMTGFLLLTSLTGSFWEGLGRVTNLDQSSIMLFLFFDGIALLPLAMAVTAVFDGASRRDASAFEKSSGVGRSPQRPRPRWPGSKQGWSLRGLAMFLVVVIALSVGAWTTVVDGPAYLQSNVGKTSNVTASDVLALEWAGSHLPSCSVVLVAPGSAAQFLPEYATVRVAFPMNPIPTNSSYQVAVTNLTQGVYSSETRAALVALGISEVFVTGATSVSFPPFLLHPLASSPDFSLVFSSGDAAIFAFLPVIASTQCLG